MRPDGQLREITTDIFKRDRYRNAMGWYYLLDSWGIDYLKEKMKNHEYHFFDSRIIKNYFNLIRSDLGGANNESFQISGSKSFGVLRTPTNRLFSIYVFPKDPINLSYNMEYRFELFAKAYIFKDNDYKYGYAIMINNENYNNAFLFCATLVLLLLNYKNTRLFGVRTENYKRMESFVQSKVDSSVSNDGSAGIPILNMTQDSQMNYFFNKTYYDNTFRNIILNEQGENSREIEDKVLSEHPAATVYKGMPCVFLMDLDIENFYHIMKYSIFLKVSYYFVCFEKHKEVIEATVKAIYQYHDIDIESKVVSIEEIIKNYDVSL